MTSKHTRTIAGQLNAARVLIENSMAHRHILALVAAHGYDGEMLAEGHMLLQVAIRAIDQQAAAAGSAQLAAEQVRHAVAQARAAYQGLVQIARAIYPPNASQRKSLDISGPMPDNTAAFIAAATTLFNNALNVPEIGAQLARYGYNAERLTQERVVFVTYQQAVRAQDQAKGAARQATREQRAALRALQVWVSQYAKIARVALRAEPELLKLLGLALPGGRPGARRATSRKSAEPAVETEVTAAS
jgi:hypothetical protein